MRTPLLSSLLLGSVDPDRLRGWYGEALGVHPDPDGFLHFGPVGVLVEGRDDVAGTAVEPGRVVLNYEVSDIRARARHLDGLGVTWVSPVEYAKAAAPGSARSPIRTATTSSSSSSPPTTGRSDGPATRARRDEGRRCACHLCRPPAGSGPGRARGFYADKLGLEPAESREAG